MATFGQWLDDYSGEDNLVAGVAHIWRTAKGDRPRVSAPQSITGWLAEHRGVADEALRAAVRTYNESRSGRQATEAEVGAFRAMNEPGTIAPVTDGHEQPAGPSPAMMAALGRIEKALDERLGAIYLAVTEGFQAVYAWTRLQDERIKPITDLLGELAEAEQAPDQPEPDGQVAEAMEASQGPDLGDEEHAHVAGSLWRDIVAPEPDPERMAQLGDPRLVEE